MTETQTMKPAIAAPAEIHPRFTEVVNGKDIDGLLALYEPDGIAVRLDGVECSGDEAMREMALGLTSAIRHIDGSTRKLFVAGEIALSSASWRAEVVLPDGSIVVQEGITAEVLRRQSDGTWKFVIDDPMFS